MGVIKDGVNHICKRLDDIRTMLQQIKYEAEAIRRRVDAIHSEIDTRNDMINDFCGDLLEALKEGKPPKELTVQPVEAPGSEKLFLVTGEELCNLLEACKGAKLQMKEK